jgi:hypothetical protein
MCNERLERLCLKYVQVIREYGIGIFFKDILRLYTKDMQNFRTRSWHVWDANEEEGVVARYLKKTKITHFDIGIEEHYTFIHV